MARKFTYDQEKVTKLRMLVIEASIEVMENKASVNKWSAYKKELVAKIAPRVLPTLNAGKSDNEDFIPHPIYAGKSIKTKEDEKGSD